MLARIVLCLFLSREIISLAVRDPSPQFRSTHTFLMGDARVDFCTSTGSHSGSHAGLIKRALVASEPNGHGGQSNSSSQDSHGDSPLSTMPIDLTPAKYTNSTCYPGTFQRPALEDCEKVIQAQLYNSTGSLEASPGTWVFVSYGTCATVFQNPEESSYTLQYNWAELGAQAGKIAGRCLSDDDLTMGGAFLYEKYLKYKFEGVMISLQRFDDRDIL
ncbi:hypothetical protein PCANC_17114 [Puccinia coronata f. sp. avenae]|nr:hypothetical protein PCANC_20175 [Puccinia coronata f. sp. avenae]PLW24903.1 hypothetical protein PCASD_23676 [Puccinia coronata f. sp. avenae]PLW32898.1 hypothetical protein PCANC_17114 [Puccinia coronata f. sp. avenae]